jgi:hypothetical protein
MEVGALIAAALFTGAAFYINWAEHPARMSLPPGTALAQWKPAYKAGYRMQASLALAGGACALAAGALSGDARWLGAGVVLLANWPYTLFAIAPVNKMLMRAAPETAGEETHALLQRWNALHAGRTALGAAAVALMAWIVLS